MKANLKIVAGVGAAMLFAGSASAAVLTTVAPDIYSKEGVSVTTNATVTLPVIDAVLAADYSADDRIAVTISGASVVSASDLTADMTCGNDIVVGFLNRSGNTLNFRVNQVGIQAANLGAECAISGIQVLKSSLVASSTVSATYAAKTALGEVIDTGCATPGYPGELVACSTIGKDFVPNYVVVAGVKSQFAAGLTAKADGGTGGFNGVIDVEQDREVFTDGDSDTSDVTMSSDTTLVEAVENASVELKLTADFSWAAGADKKCGTADDAGLDSIPGDVSIATDCGSATVDYGVIDGYEGATVVDLILATVPGLGSGIKLSPQAFQAEAIFSWGTNKSVTIPFSAGAWSINGALVFVPYMPYGDNISQIIYIANRGSQPGAITIDAFDENGASYTFDVGTVSAGTVRKLTAEILTGLTNAGFMAPGKVAFEITVTAPDKDIDVYSAYNVGGTDRGTVVNSQNGKALNDVIVD